MAFLISLCYNPNHSENCALYCKAEAEMPLIGQKAESKRIISSIIKKESVA
jgi:hypothetical protein